MKFSSFRDSEESNKMIDEVFENLDLGIVCRSEIDRAAAMIDLERERRNMTKDERDEEIRNAYNFDECALEFIHSIFTPVNDLRSDKDIISEDDLFQEDDYIPGDRESIRERFRKRLEFDLKKSGNSFDIEQKNSQQGDSEQVVDSGGRSPGE